MRGRRRIQRSYSSKERAEALRQLALNKGNILKTARQISIPITTLRNWQDEELRKSKAPQAKEIEKFAKNAWKNILMLSKPSFVKKISARALEEGKLKEILSLLAIFEQMPVFGRKENNSKTLIDIRDQVKRNADELRKLRIMLQKILKPKN